MNRWLFYRNLKFGDQRCFEYKYLHQDKFENDRVFINNKNYFIILDGVIFNNHQLIKKHNAISWEDAILKMYESTPNFYEKFRGSFNGVIYDIGCNKITTFTNHLGERPVFYYKSDDIYLVSSDFNMMHSFLKEHNIPYTMSEYAMECMLTIGYMIDQTTYINEVKRLLPGQSIIYINNKFILDKYFEFNSNNTIEISDREAIERIDECFRNALKQEFDKDLEYGYSSIIDISGGLDSRMVAFVAKEMGYNDSFFLCYSQSGSYEYKIAQEVADYLRQDLIFYPLNNGNCLMEIDELVEQNYGLNYYAGITGGKKILSKLNLNNIGIEHTGLLGDMYEGSFSMKEFHEPAYLEQRYRYSRVLSTDRINIPDYYPNNEMFYFYTRGLLSGLNSHLIRRNYVETFSPFMDVDFLKLSFSLPLPQRMSGHIFLKWMLAKYPEAAKIKYARTHGYVLENPVKTKLRDSFLRGCHFLNRKAHSFFPASIKLKAYGMNPFDHWYYTNPILRQFINEYFQSGIKQIGVSEELKSDIISVFNSDLPIDKLVALTVIGVYKKYFA